MEFNGAVWRKSTFSETEACVEVAWRKPGVGTGRANCVEVAEHTAVVGIRDSKRPHGGHLSVPHSAFRALHQAVDR